jgi:spermidine synthase
MGNYSLEMLVHTALSTHKEPKNILVVTDEKENIEHEFSKHKFLELQTTFTTLEKFPDLESENFDVAIFDISENIDQIAISHIHRVLDSKGLLSIRGNFETLKMLSNNFLIAMPYLIFSIDEKSEIQLFASKFYHPTADINLQRADFLDNCEYYNSDTHTSSFVMPNFIKSEIKDFVRN